MKRAAWDRTKGRPEPIRALDRVRLVEDGSPLVDLREVAPKVRMARPQVIPFVRERVAEMCREASERLPEGYGLSLIEGWRPLARQQRIYDFFWRAATEAFPDRDYAALRRTVCRWVAPTDRPAPPGHCTGAAVDVWLTDANGESLDVSSPYDRFQAAPTYSLGLSEEASRNRTILVETMLAVGFSNCRDEWWHYSWGDAGWAVRMDERSCPFGIANLPYDLYADLEEEHARAMDTRTNPFL